jgi:hypothetical protein
MTSTRLRALAALLSLVPAAGLFVAAPAQAATDITVKSVSLSKTTLVLSGTAGCTASITFTAVLSAPLPTEGYSLSGVGVDLYGPGTFTDDDYVDGVELAEVGTTSTYKGSLKLCGKYGAGKFEADVYGALVPEGATGDDDVDVTNVVTTGITVKRPATLSLNAGPEPVKKGKTVTSKGTLKIDGKVLSGASVKIYFKAKGASSYTYKGTAKTSSKGAYSKGFKATKSGTWKATYAGSTTRNSASATDAVAVK